VSNRDGRLFTNSSIYLAANVLNSAIPFFLLPFLTRYLSLAEYGAVGMFQMALALFGAFTGLSANAAASREYFENRPGDALAVYIGTCVQLVVLATCFTAGITWLLAAPLAGWTGLTPGWLLVAVIASGAVGLVQLPLGQWQVRGEAIAFGIFQITQSLLNMGLSLWLVVAMERGLEGRLVGASLPPIIFAVVGIVLLRHRRMLAFIWRPAVIREILGFGLPLVPHLAGLFMLAMFDRLAVNHFLGLEQIGVYMVAVQLSLGIGVIAEAANKGYMPWMYSHLKQESPDTNRRIVRGNYLYFGAIIAVAALAALIAPVFVPWFAGESYAEAGRIFVWFAIGEAFNGSYLIISNYIYYSKKTAILSWVTVASGCLHIALVILLIQRYAMEGAAMAFALSTGVRFFLAWLAAQRRHPMPWLLARTRPGVEGQ
jgi:O-antigen/teichoic acid export membrane protein